MSKFFNNEQKGPVWLILMTCFFFNNTDIYILLLFNVLKHTYLTKIKQEGGFLIPEKNPLPRQMPWVKIKPLPHAVKGEKQAFYPMPSHVQCENSTTKLRDSDQKV